MNLLPPPTTAAAGWYPDPSTGGVRYFDGRSWVGEPVTPAGFAATTPHPDLPLAAAVGALVVLVASLLAGKLALDAIAADWPLVADILVVAVVSYGPSIGWVWYVRRRWAGGSLAGLGFTMRWIDLAWGPLTWLAAVLVQAVAALVILALHIPFTSNIESGGPDGDRSYVIALLVVAVVVAPVIEEVIFRGLILRGLLSRAPIAVAVIGQGILFGAVHVDPVRGTGNVGLVIVLASVGAVLGGSAYLFRRLGPPMLAHAILNGVALAIALSGALDHFDSPFGLLTVVGF